LPRRFLRRRDLDLCFFFFCSLRDCFLLFFFFFFLLRVPEEEDEEDSSEEWGGLPALDLCQASFFFRASISVAMLLYLLASSRASPLVRANAVELPGDRPGAAFPTLRVGLEARFLRRELLRVEALASSSVSASEDAPRCFQPLGAFLDWLVVTPCRIWAVRAA